MQQFQDRRDAGCHLARQLMKYADRDDVLVLGLPRGGVPVAYEVAKALKAPLDIFLVRKLGVPGRQELALGAIASGGVRVLNEDVVSGLDIDEALIERIAAQEMAELQRREAVYRIDRRLHPIVNQTVILVDDGLATGATMLAAVVALRQLHPAEIVIAVPTASPETCRRFQDEVDDVVCAITPEPFMGVGLWYEDFEQTSDDEVRQLLAQAAHWEKVTNEH
jgi:putative phosphoribosyl transferase